MTGTIDLAFVDRADIKQYLGIPTVPAIYQIYSSCVNELIKVKTANTEKFNCIFESDKGKLH